MLLTPGFHHKGVVHGDTGHHLPGCETGLDQPLNKHRSFSSEKAGFHEEDASAGHGLLLSKKTSKKTLHSLSNRAIFTSGNNLVLLKHIETSDNTRTLFNPHSRTKPPPSTGLWCSMSAPSTRSIDFRARIHQGLDQRRSPHPLEHPVGSVWMLSGGPGDRRGEWLTFSRRGRRSEEVDP